jgi:hypothetical protein
MSAPTPAHAKLATDPSAESSTEPHPEAGADAPANPGPVPCTQQAAAPRARVAKIINDDEEWARMMSPLVERYGQ